MDESAVAALTLRGDCSHCVHRAQTIKTHMERDMQPSCSHCAFRSDRPFCDMSPDAIRRFDEIKEQAILGKGALLFVEGRPSRGVYVLCEGRAKLSICSESGKRLMLRVAGPGEVLGLGSTLGGNTYEVTAELLDTAQVAFVKRKDIVKFLRLNPTICMEVVRRLSDDLHGAYERVRSIGLSRSRKIRPQRVRPIAS